MGLLIRGKKNNEKLRRTCQFKGRSHAAPLTGGDKEPILKIKVIIALVLFIVSGGCVSAPGYFGPNKVRPYHMEERLQYKGFSVAKPPNNDWYTIVSEQYAENCIFRRDTSSSEHSIFVDVSLFTETADIENVGDLIQMLSIQYRTTERIEILKKDIKPSEKFAGICIEYDIRGQDKTLLDKNGQHYQISYIGFMCVHPTFQGRVVDIGFSERGPIELFEGILPDDAKQMIESVHVESSPMVTSP